ncbi:hypothetical protein, partial [Desulfurella sp.]
KLPFFILFDFIIKIYFQILIFLSNLTKIIHINPINNVVVVLLYIVLIALVELIVNKISVASFSKANLSQ